MKHEIRRLGALLLTMLLLFSGTAFAEDPAKEQVYLRATELIAEGQSDAALAVLALIPGYKDADVLAQEIKTAKMEAYYLAAAAKMEEGQYDAAIAIFALIPGYKDSDIQAVLAADGKKQGRYDAAIALMEARAYDDALKIFRELDAYADSAAKMAQIFKLQAQQAFDAAFGLEAQGKYAEAVAAYQALDPTPEIAVRIQACVDEMDKAAFLEELETVELGDDPLAYYRELLALEQQNALTVARFGDSPFNPLLFAQGAAILNEMDSHEEAIALLSRFDAVKKRELLRGVMNPLQRLGILRHSEPGDTEDAALLASTLLEAAGMTAGDNPQAAFNYISEAAALGAAVPEVTAAYDAASRSQIRMLFGADAVVLPLDTDADGVTEYAVSGASRFSLSVRTADGLVFADAPQSPAFDSMTLEKATDGRQYIVGKTGRATWLVQPNKDSLLVLAQAEDLLSHEWTSTGFVLRFLLGGAEYRRAQKEYIVMDGQAVALPDTRVLDMAKYPERKDAYTLMQLYTEARAFGIPEESALLVREGADLTALDAFLDASGKVDAAEIFLWDAGTGLYHIVVEAEGARMVVLAELGADGQYMLAGAR